MQGSNGFLDKSLDDGLGLVELDPLVVAQIDDDLHRLAGYSASRSCALTNAGALDEVPQDIGLGVVGSFRVMKKCHYMW